MRKRLISFSSLLLLPSIPPKKCPSSRRLINSNKSYHQNTAHVLNFCNFPTSARYFGSSNYQNCARFSTQSTVEEANGSNQLEVEIIGKEFIKPGTPTPEGLRIHEFSSVDQLYPNIYTPFVFFYPNNHKHDGVDSTLKLLRQSLSETLIRFYPLAGRISKDKKSIDCNDMGVHYVEAKVDDRLSDFLNNQTTSSNKSVHQLLPMHPDPEEWSSRTDVAMVQVTTFNCGGLAIGLYSSHQILDGYSIVTFLKGWAATARGVDEKICPTFVASSIFPPSSRANNGNATSWVVPFFPQGIKPITRRFVFPASSLATLKVKTGASRALSVAGFLAKCYVTTTTSSTTNPKYTYLTIPVNIREKLSLPPYCIGNIILGTPPIICSVNDQLDTIVQQLKNSVNKIDKDLVNEMKGPGFVDKGFKELKKTSSDIKTKLICVAISSHMGMYEADFGWGGPIWVNFGLADSKLPIMENFAMLMETRSGNGIEAWTTLPEEDMVHFERDPELLSLATINPSPLHEPV